LHYLHSETSGKPTSDLHTVI